MKTNIFLTIISILLASLIGYLAFSITEGKDNDILCGIGTSLCLFTTLMPAIGLQYEDGRLGTNIKVFSSLFFMIFLISNFCFAGFGVNMPLYIIVNGIMVIIYLAIVYKFLNNNLQ